MWHTFLPLFTRFNWCTCGCHVPRTQQFANRKVWYLKKNCKNNLLCFLRLEMCTSRLSNYNNNFDDKDKYKTKIVFVTSNLTSNNVKVHSVVPGNLLSRVLSGPVWRLPQGLHRQILSQSPWCHWKQKSKWPLDFCEIWRSGTVRQKVQLFTSMDPRKYQQLSVGRSGMCGEAGERWFVWTSTVASD